MSRHDEGVTDLLAGLDSGAAALNNRRVVREAQRADHESASVEAIDWRKTLRPRVLLAGSLILLWTVGIVARLVYLQVLQYDVLVARAESQQSQTIDLNPRRGQILDRYGRVLAYSVDGDVIYAAPSDVRDPEATASALCDVLDDCDAEERKSLLQRLHSQRGKALVVVSLTED